MTLAIANLDEPPAALGAPQDSHSNQDLADAVRGARIPSLDGLRGLSILAVLFAHGAKDPSAGHHLAVFASRLAGAWGVLCFFVISGYLITRLLRTELLRSNRIDLRAFYIRRICRIFPAFYLFLAVIALLAAFGLISIPPDHLAVVAFHLANYAPLLVDASPQSGWYLGHCWTLALEEQFYLVWPAAICLIGLRGSVFLAAVACMLCPVLRVITYLVAPEQRGMTMMMFHTGSDAILIGCLVALLEGSPQFEKFTQFCRNPWTPWLAGAWLLGISAPLTYCFRGMYQLTVGRTLDACAMCIILLSLVRAPHSPAGYLVNTRALSQIGVLSYSLYLWQQLFLTSFNTTWTGLFPWNLLCAFGAAYCSRRLVEEPFLKLRRKFTTDDCRRTPISSDAPSPVAIEA